MKFVILKKSLLVFVVALIITAGLLTITYGGTNYASVYFGDTPRKIPVYCVETEEKTVALTFDSAWGADKTLDIIKTLQEYDVKATFFLVGFWAEEYPDMVKAIADAGLEIGTHSNTHSDFANLSEDQIKLKLETSIDLIKKASPETEVTLFRAPYGSYNNLTLTVAESMNLQTVQWDVDTLDWKGTSAIEIGNRVINKVKNGSIILCHNNSDNILEALPIMLDRLKLAGYKVTSVGDLIMKDNFVVDHTGMQKAK